MTRILQLLFFIICTTSTLVIAQQQKAFDYQVNKDGSVIVKSKDGGSLLIKSTFIVLKRTDNPSIHFENQSKRESFDKALAIRINDITKSSEYSGQEISTLS